MVGVLDVEAGNLSAHRVLLLFALLEGAESAPEKIETLVANHVSTIRSTAAVLPVESENAVRFIGIPNVELILDPFPSEDQLLPATHPRHVIVKGESVVVEVGNRIGSSSYREFAFRHLESVRHRLVEIHA